MARDYLAIPATSCIAERSFSMSAQADDPHRGRMHQLKFGSLQKLHAGYLDGCVRVSKYPGIKLNSKVVIFDNHLTLIYFTCGKTI